MSEKIPEEELKKLPFRNSSLDIEDRVKDLLERLELKEKIFLCAGRKMFFTRPIRRLGIPHLKITDGPH